MILCYGYILWFCFILSSRNSFQRQIGRRLIPRLAEANIIHILVNMQKPCAQNGHMVLKPV